MNGVELFEGDSNEVLLRLIAEGRQVHSCVCDPPYFLESIVKRFGKDGSKAAKAGSDGRFSRQSAGFMGRTWDGADSEGYRIAHDPEFWRKVYDLLLPGGFCLAFSSPRTGHHQAVAMEAAGFIMHPFIGWTYSTGFPKAHAVVRGAPEAQEWDGWYYGTQTLKPAIEPIYVGQKPFSEKTGTANILLHGVGAFNVNGCRVPTTENLNGGAYAKERKNSASEWAKSGSLHKTTGKEFVQPDGRWPANLIHDGSPEVLAMFPRAEGQKSPSLTRGADPENKTSHVYGEMSREADAMLPRGDGGSAGRFFNSFPRYSCADCSDLGWTVSQCHPPEQVTCDSCAGVGGYSPLDQPILHYPKAGKTDRAGSLHPTVKPVALMRHLVRLVTPVSGFVLDPFAGSGTTGQAAVEEGMQVIMIEREADYIADIRRRFALDQRADDSQYARLLQALFAA